MADNYQDYLIDCALLIGGNESSGLLSISNAPASENVYQQQILGAVSSTVAMFPFSSTSHEYPAEKFRKPDCNSTGNDSQSNFKRQFSENEFQTIHELVSQYNKKEISDMNMTSSIKRRNSKLRSKRRSIKNIAVDAANQSWGSVSMETMKSFPAIYFKNNLQISSVYKVPLIQFIPLTDNMGNRSFAIRIEFHRKFTIIPNYIVDVDKLAVLDLKPANTENEDSTETVYVPNNVIFFTKFPYFDLFRDILSHFFRQIDGADSVKIEKELVEYCQILTRIPVLRSTNLRLIFSINDRLFTIKRTIPFFQEIIDWDMTILFQTLSIDDILAILMAMFQEQKIVFLADDSNLITIITESIFLLFRPFQWKHFYLTTTPSQLYELVDAIFPFMLGLPHTMKPKIREYYPDIIIVDLQEGETFIPSSCKLKSVSNDLVDKVKQAFLHRDWIQSSTFNTSLTPLTMEEYHLNYSTFNESFSQKVLSIFMTFMVDLFEEVIENIPTDKRNDVVVVTFDRYLNTSQSQNVPFFNEIYRTDNFTCFIDERIRRKIIDPWFHICSHRYPSLADDSKLKSTLTTQRRRVDSNFPVNIDEISVNEAEESFQEVIFPSTKKIKSNFYYDVLEIIDKVEDTIDVMKLRAEIRLCSGNTIKALEEFHRILKMPSSDLNISKIRRLVRGLGKTEFRCLQSLPFHSSLFQMIHFNERISIANAIFEMPKVEQFNSPTSPIPKEIFIDVCQNADITENEVAMNTLFNCLTIECKTTKNRIKTVHPEIFKCFYNNWVNLSIDLQDIEISTDFVDETLIKGTETSIRVDGYGLGRIVLTQYRLCFIPFAKNNCTTIVNFAENLLKRVKMEIKLRGFGKRSEVLELTFTNSDSKVIIWVGHDCNVWYQLISEISFVNRLAEQEKDKNLVNLMTDLCLMYENMVSCARNNGFFKNNIADIGKKMLSHINEKKSSKKDKEENHRRYIIVKLMPAPKKVVTIDCTAEIYKPCVNNFDIWCACMSRDTYFIKILQILDKKLYRLQDVTIEMTTRVQTMVCLPNTNKIAIACMSHVVLLMDTNSHMIERTIVLNINTAAYPICSANSPFDQRVLFFGTNKGEIMNWDSQIDKVNQIVKLPNEDHASSIHVYDSNTLIVGSLYSFYVISYRGEVINVIIVSEFNNIMNKLSFITLTNDNKTLIAALARLPVMLEYDISNIRNITCTRKKNIFSNREYLTSDVTELFELSSTYVGITTVLSVDDSAHGKCLWLMFKDGTIEIRESKTWFKITKFNAHVDVITKGVVCTIKNQKVIVSVGREDGKVNLWSPSPLF